MRIFKLRLAVLAKFFSVILIFVSSTAQLLHGDISETAGIKSQLEKIQGPKEIAVNPTAFPSATVESQGLSSSSLNKLTYIVHKFVKEDKIVGAELVIIKNRHTVLHEVFGWLDREDKKPMKNNTLFNIRSMTKPLTGSAIQILIDRGRLKLSDPVSKYLPGFRNEKSREITIEQLLTHRSGLPLTYLSISSKQSFSEQLSNYDNLISLANTVGQEGPNFPPGTKFWYSDAGTDVLGAVIEVIAGIPLDQFIEQNILQQLGMKDTDYNTQKHPRKDNRIASLYVGAEENWKRFYKSGDDPFYLFALGSQSLYSTPQDYARFLAMWLDKGKFNTRQVLSEEAISRLLSPVSEMSSLGSDMQMPTGFLHLKVCYGQMAMIYIHPEKSETEPVVIGHSGSDGTHAWAWPKRDLMILYFTQSRGQLTGLTLEKHIDQLLINPGRPGDSIAVPNKLKPLLGKYTGVSHAMQNGVFTILMQNGSLALDVPGQMVFELKKADAEGQWAFKLDPNTKFSFKKNDQGRVTGMTMNKVTSLLRKEGEADVADDCPEKYRPLLGKYVLAVYEFTVRWQNERLTIGTPSGDVVPLKGPDPNGLWNDTRNNINVICFKKEKSGRVISMDWFETHQFKKGVAAAVLVERVVEEQGIEAGIKKYHELKAQILTDCYFDASSFNILGYKLMNQKKISEAIAVFKLNTKAFPDTWNTYDSLAEAYMKNGNKKLAIINYQKSLELNPDNTNAKKLIKKLKE